MGTTAFPFSMCQYFDLEPPLSGKPDPLMGKYFPFFQGRSTFPMASSRSRVHLVCSLIERRATLLHCHPYIYVAPGIYRKPDGPHAGERLGQAFCLAHCLHLCNIASRRLLGPASTKEETPSLGTKPSTDDILGMAKTEGSLKMLLDIDKVLDPRGIHVPA